MEEEEIALKNVSSLLVLFIFMLFCLACMKKIHLQWKNSILRSNHPEVLLRKGVLKICGKFTGEHPCRSVISTKLLYNFIEIALRHGCSSL